MIKVAINGYGRIGRVAHRVILEKYLNELDVVAINAGKSTDIKGWMFLLKYDTSYGPIYSMDVSVNKMFGTKWIVNATLSDAFNTRRMGAHYQTPYYVQDLSRRRETRYVRLAVTYLFGKMDASIFKRAKQMRSNDSQGNQDGLDFGK